MSIIAREIWDEAKTRAMTLHGEGLQTALDIALNDSRANDPKIRSELRSFCHTEKPVRRLSFKSGRVTHGRGIQKARASLSKFR